MSFTERMRDTVGSVADQAKQASTFGVGAVAGWYPDAANSTLVRYWDGEQWTEHTQPATHNTSIPQVFTPTSPPVHSGTSTPRMEYVVLQVTLKEKLIGTGSGNLTQLERAINNQAAKGYKLHTITTATGGSSGLGGGDRIQATMVFEKIV